MLKNESLEACNKRTLIRLFLYNNEIRKQILAWIRVFRKCNERNISIQSCIAWKQEIQQ